MGKKKKKLSGGVPSLFDVCSMYGIPHSISRRLVMYAYLRNGCKRAHPELDGTDEEICAAIDKFELRLYEEDFLEDSLHETYWGLI